MLKINDTWDKISLIFASVSILTYWLIIFNGVWGICLSVINSIFWISYFWKKNIIAQIIIHISYMLANIIFFIHYFKL